MEVTSTKKEIWTMGTYSLLTLSIMVGFMYLNTFATEVLVIPAETLAIALGVAKAIDFVFSLVAGGIIEKVKISKKGKNQSWLFVGRWILAVMIMAEVCNTSGTPLVVRVAVLSVSYTVLNCLMNILQTAYYGIVAAVAGPNMANRNAMTVNMTRQATVVTLICSFIPMAVTSLPFGSWNYFVVAVVFMLPMPWALGAIAKCGEGKDLPVDKEHMGPTVSIGDMFSTLFKNPQMLVLFLAFTVLYTGQYIYQGNYTYYFIYVAGDFTLLTWATLIAAVLGFFAAMIMPKLAVKIGKKWSLVLAFFVMGAGLIFVNFLGAQGWIMYVIGIGIMTFGTYIYMPFYVTIFLDAGEYFLWKTGKDTRVVAASLASPPMKIGMFLGGTIGLMLLSGTGFASGGMFAVTPEWIGSYMQCSFLVPGIIYICAGILMALFYKISDADAAKYAKENAEKMAQQQQ